ncbi:MAG: alanine--tRNA ligase, partial [Parcubacteria group bacterium]|nr:alanine--tRNA ligase [Parcubacteria group bacterium]
RQKFLDFFAGKGHRIIPSSSLIPDNDSSVLFTTAGMQQFKLYYSGIKNPFTDIHSLIQEPLNNLNVTTCQKCLRTSDIEAVGDESHLTFFEMLGNFSFGGYFKEEAIKYAWQFINQILEIPLSRITISVFKGNEEIPFDEESYQTWLKLGVPQEKIILGERKDNFWGPTGNEGPCGPTTEIYVDGVEIWNLVFNQYYQTNDKKLTPLKVNGVDTGMGLERLVKVMQFPQDESKTIFNTDIFKDLMSTLKENSAHFDERIHRIIADHYRATIFVIASGILPSNTDKGYILRRLIRRLVRFAKLINLSEDWYLQGYNIIKNKYSHFYPELNNQEEIISIFNLEKEKFEKTLLAGSKEWEKLLKKLGNNKIISGKDAFRLYESYGFPLEILEDMAQEQGKEVDKIEFEKEFNNHQNISRAGQTKKFGGHGINTVQNEKDKIQITKLHTATHLLLAALRQIIDPKIEQKGSDITPQRLRFDFPFNRRLTEEELQKIENIVNEAISQDLVVNHYETSYEEAVKNGVLGTFKDRYPEKVIVYEIKNKNTGQIFSAEICAGPHVTSTKELGRFQILKEEAVGQGIRRIKACLI